MEFGNTPSKLQIPPHTLIIMVRRGEDFFVPTGSSALEVGDQLLVISDQDAEASFKQLANDAEEEALWRAEMKQKAKKRWMRATMAAAKSQGKAAIESAKLQAQSIKDQTANNNNLQKESINFTRQQNQENRQQQQK